MSQPAHDAPAATAGPSTRSAVVAGVITLLVVALMVNLGLWQLRRHAEVADVNAALVARLDADPVPYFGGGVDPDDDRFLAVEATGTWRPDDEVLWRNRARNRVNGSYVLTPLDLVGGGTLLVARGWLPPGLEVRDASPPPEGTVTVTGLLRRSVDQPGFGPQDPPYEGEDLDAFFHADVGRIDQQVDGELEPMWLQATAGATGQDEVLRPMDEVRPDAGPHLGYALQWFGFSATALAAYGAWLWSRVLRPRRDAPAA